MLPTKMHMIVGAATGFGATWNDKFVKWKRVTRCGKYLRLELTTTDWAKVTCKKCLLGKH